MMQRDELLSWLTETDETKLEELWKRADDVRTAHVGQDVHLRGLVEFSNYCARPCTYCGLRASSDVPRYRMTEDEILACAHEAITLGFGTLVMQSGQDAAMSVEWLTNVVQRVKAETPLAVTLSVGEWSHDAYATWYDAGADRFLLRFETSNREIYDRIHPPVGKTPSDRLAILRDLRKIGYEIGSGVMIGIPGQAYNDLAQDIELFGELDLDMIGVGPYIAHPDTPLAHEDGLDGDDQVPNTEGMTYKVLALTRILYPGVNIPATTALATLNKAKGRELGLSRGANVLMPNLTPVQYRESYEIYPAKACVKETAVQCNGCMRGRIASIGRTVGTGRGDSPHWQDRREQTETHA
jgi:biotin synthase